VLRSLVFPEINIFYIRFEFKFPLNASYIFAIRSLKLISLASVRLASRILNEVGQLLVERSEAKINFKMIKKMIIINDYKIV
jgi:hypothetical protein